MVINGKIPLTGDVNSYTLRASADQTLTIESLSFSDAFDPSAAILELSGSWFDPQRLNFVASSDEPLSFPGLSTNARLVERFPHAGTWILRVQGFHGSGGPDCVYRLRIASGEMPPPLLHPTIEPNWEERQFTRRLTVKRMHDISVRAAQDAGARRNGLLVHVQTRAAAVYYFHRVLLCSERRTQRGKQDIPSRALHLAAGATTGCAVHNLKCVGARITARLLTPTKERPSLGLRHSAA